MSHPPVEHTFRLGLSPHYPAAAIIVGRACSITDGHGWRLQLTAYVCALWRTLRKYSSIYRFADPPKFVWRVTISLRSSPMKFAIARLEESLVTEIPVTNNSTRPEEVSKTFTMSEPSEFKVQVQESGRNPHSTIWRSSRVDIISFSFLGRKPINGCFATC